MNTSNTLNYVYVRVRQVVLLAIAAALLTVVAYVLVDRLSSAARSSYLARVKSPPPKVLWARVKSPVPKVASV